MYPYYDRETTHVSLKCEMQRKYFSRNIVAKPRSMRARAMSSGVVSLSLPTLANPCQPLLTLANPCQPLPTLANPCQPLPTLVNLAGPFRSSSHLARLYLCQPLVQ